MWNGLIYVLVPNSPPTSGAIVGRLGKHIDSNFFCDFVLNFSNFLLSASSKN